MFSLASEEGSEQFTVWVRIAEDLGWAFVCVYTRVLSSRCFGIQYVRKESEIAPS